MDRTKQPGIEIAQIIVERAVFEHRDDYLSVPSNTQVTPLPLKLRAQSGLDADKKRATIRLEVVTDRAQRPLYFLEVVVIALVRVQEGAANMPLEHYATVNGAAMLFPFVRELVASLTGRGRFGPVWLHPLNLVAGAKTATPTDVPKRSRSSRAHALRRKKGSP